MTYIYIYHFSSLFRKSNMGEETDCVGKKLTSQIFPRGKKLICQFFPGERMGQPVLSPGEKLTWEKTDHYTGNRIASARNNTYSTQNYVPS